MLHRIRMAMQSGSIMKMGGGGGECEADETFLGGKARNMHLSVKSRLTFAEVTGKVGETANYASRLEEAGTEEERLALRFASRSCFSCSIAAFTIFGSARSRVSIVELKRS